MKRSKILPTPVTAGPVIRSRRRARLRVVGTDAFGTRHATFVTICGSERIFEVLTFAEYDALPAALRSKPDCYYMLPGMGWLLIRRPHDDEEREDVLDAAKLAKELYDAERTPEW